MSRLSRFTGHYFYYIASVDILSYYRVLSRNVAVLIRIASRDVDTVSTDFLMYIHIGTTQNP
ncbi:hypothetical protein V1499_04085 [Neobacillus sp. SCS-31]|uniref:hypothetical protein n=1 Tax=Neobacillus oceani TaxID=3115292 RepID=UPI003906C2D7